MKNVKVVICYSTDSSFDEFLDMTDEEVHVFGLQNNRLYSLLDFEHLANCGDYENTDSYFKFIEL